MKRRSFEQRFRDKLAEYEQAYDLSSVNSANDKDNLRALISNALIIEDLHEMLQEMSDSQSLDPANIEKTTQLIQKLLATNQQLERQLGIDRKTRRASGSDSVSEYIASLQEAAKQFLDQRLTRVICPKCHVMVGRFAPVHDHTRYVVAFQCSQCREMVALERDERSVWFDLKPREYRWRKNYPVSIRPAKARKINPILTGNLAGVVLESELEEQEPATPAQESIEIEDATVVINDKEVADHGNNTEIN